MSETYNNGMDKPITTPAQKADRALPSTTVQPSVSAATQSANIAPQNMPAIQQDVRAFLQILQSINFPVTNAMQSAIQQNEGKIFISVSSVTPLTIKVTDRNNAPLGTISIPDKIIPAPSQEILQRLTQFPLTTQNGKIELSFTGQNVQNARFIPNNAAPVQPPAPPPLASLQLSQFPTHQIAAPHDNRFLAVRLPFTSTPTTTGQNAAPIPLNNWPTAPTSSSVNAQITVPIATGDWPKNLQNAPVFRIEIPQQQNPQNPSQSTTIMAQVTAFSGEQKLPIVTASIPQIQNGQTIQIPVSMILLTSKPLQMGQQIPVQFLPPPQMQNTMAMTQPPQNPAQQIGQILQQSGLLPSAPQMQTQIQAQTQPPQIFMPTIAPAPPMPINAPAIAQSNTVNIQLPSALLFILSALKMADFSGWAGQNAMQNIQQKLSAEQLKRLENAFKDSVRTANDITGQKWRVQSVPIHTPSDPQNPIQAVEVLTRHYDGADDGQNAQNQKKQDTRFILNLELSQLGAMQIDGFLKEQRLDIFLRSAENLDEPFKSELQAAFAVTLEQIGLTGQLLIQQTNPDDHAWHKLIPEQEPLSIPT